MPPEKWPHPSLYLTRIPLGSARPSTQGALRTGGAHWYLPNPKMTLWSRPVSNPTSAPPGLQGHHGLARSQHPLLCPPALEKLPGGRTSHASRCEQITRELRKRFCNNDEVMLCFLHTGTIRSALDVLTHLILLISPGARHYYSPYFSDQGLGHGDATALAQDTQLVSGRAKFRIQAVGSRIQVLNQYEYCLQK